MNDFSEKYLPFLRTHFLPLALGTVGLIFFVYGLSGTYQSVHPSAKDKPDILFEAASDVNEDAIAGAATKEIVVDVAGAVMKPGVYKLKADSRVQDALIAAGGMNEDADREKVAKSLNLASRLTDGAKLYIPAVGEEMVASQGMSDGASAGSGNGLININSATPSELESLPGVGAVTAEKIIDNRPYTSLDELVEKKVVGKSTFEKIKDKISL